MLRGLFFQAWGSLTSLKSQTRDPQLKVPPGGLVLRIFTNLKKILRPQWGLNPRTLDLEARRALYPETIEADLLIYKINTLKILRKSPTYNTILMEVSQNSQHDTDITWTKIIRNCDGYLLLRQHLLTNYYENIVNYLAECLHILFANALTSQQYV